MGLPSRDPILLTPGPLTTTLETRTAMLRDWGSWDAAFHAVTAGTDLGVPAIGPRIHVERWRGCANGNDSLVGGGCID